MVLTEEAMCPVGARWVGLLHWLILSSFFARHILFLVITYISPCLPLSHFIELNIFRVYTAET